MAGDFNGDGRLDLAVVDDGDEPWGGTNPPTVSVLLGNGDGTFQPMERFAAGGTLGIGLLAGDFNGDGKLDLATSNSVFLGNGDGTFQAAETFAAGSVSLPVVAGDFNADGKLDLAVANNYSNDVSVFLGNGDGTFQAATEYATGNNPFAALVAGDFNGDGHLDLVVLDGGDGTDDGIDASMLLANGDGTFQSAKKIAVGISPDCLVTADFNGDGRLDLAVANFSESPTTSPCCWAPATALS